MGKAAGWLFANAAFGLAPLIFLSVINPLLKAHEAGPAIHEMMRGGTVLFVCCALMGATVVDVMQSKVKLTNLSHFAINVSPFVILLIICLLYILIIVNKVDESIFTTFSSFDAFVVAFTTIYCTFAKYFFFIKKVPQT
ncbi:MAG TPA: hypothetical protein VL547_23065 [Dinghuibacter sp.]|uniref:hypothetical protein n=1 Tax=Dinghuibacter sp. TaxID=2024697 RepID=UPI002CEE4DE7|nr:hypothetical protein [Dinghuibacter sp.]HTJ14945.1 hypothetical protein [Dinghuibacter sp.]